MLPLFAKILEKPKPPKSLRKKLQTSGTSYKMLKCWIFHKQSTPPQPFGVALFGNLYNTQFNISLMERICKLKMENVG